MKLRQQQRLDPRVQELEHNIQEVQGLEQLRLHKVLEQELEKLHGHVFFQASGWLEQKQQARVLESKLS